MLSPMPGRTVIVLPGDIDPDRALWIDELRTAGEMVIDIDLPASDPAPISVRTCAAIHAAAPEPPLIVVVPPASVGIIQAVALAQRRAHRLIGGYVLIDPVDDPTGQDWPDAPVIALDPGHGVTENRARLRGWSSGAIGTAGDLRNALAQLDS